MMVLGIDPIQRLVVLRVLAWTLVAVFLIGLVSVVGVAGGYAFNVVLQDGTPGRLPGELPCARAASRPLARHGQGPRLRHGRGDRGRYRA